MPELTADRTKYNRAASLQREEREGDRAEHQAWKEGRVRPFVITNALDARQLDGPLVDAACGTCEPAVDMWEAGQLYPTWDELKALADFTDYPVAFFTTVEHWPLRAQDTSLRFHVPCPPEPPPVLCFEIAAIEAATGTTKCPWSGAQPQPVLLSEYRIRSGRNAR